MDVDVRGARYGLSEEFLSLIDLVDEDPDRSLDYMLLGPHLDYTEMGGLAGVTINTSQANAAGRENK